MDVILTSKYSAVKFLDYFFDLADDKTSFSDTSERGFTKKTLTYREILKIADF